MALRLSGVVYGALLNHRAQLDALGDAAHRPPHNTPPRAPVLAVKPRHTLVSQGALVAVPKGIDALEVGATLGMVIGRTACRVPMQGAMAFVAGYTVALEIGMAVPSHYRPSARFKSRDGFCPISTTLVDASNVHDPDQLSAQVLIDGVAAQSTSTDNRARNVAQLLVDVTAFMTLQTGDVLLLGASANPALARAGQRVEARIDGVGAIAVQLIAEPVSP